jgi:hypothetical protein
MTDMPAIHSSQHIGACDAAYTGLIVAGNNGTLVEMIQLPLKKQSDPK